MPSNNASEIHTPPVQNDQAGLRIFLRVILGALAGVFLACAVWVAVMVFAGGILPDRVRWAAAEIAGPVAFLPGAIAIGWLSFARNAFLRVFSWMIAGAGAGLVLEAIVGGGVPVGTFLTFSGIILGITGAVLGYRVGGRLRPG